MFSIGDLVLYPVFGAGLIINIEEKEIYNEIKKYYIIEFINGMNMMVPVYSSESLKIRRAISQDECIKIFDILKTNPEKLSCKWSERYRYYNKCINEGDIFKLAKILRDISGFSKTKNLSKSEVKIFNQVLNLTAGELCLVLNRDFENVKKEIVDMLEFKYELSS